MKKNIVLVVLVVVFALAGIYAFARWGESAPASLNGAQTPPTATTTEPTQTPKPDQPSGVLTVPEFVSKALAGKYKMGDVVRVSGVKTGEFKKNHMETLFYIGPPGENGMFVLLELTIGTEAYEKFSIHIKRGDTVVIEGRYDQIINNWRGVIISNVLLSP